jgi:predicted aspartyl protease
MMHGIVDSNCEATLRLVVGNTSSQRQVIDAVIDTGFTGFLTLPLSVITSLNLRLYGREEGIDVNASEAAPLVGMSLLYGYRIQLDAIEGGTVTIQPLNGLN